VSIETAKKFLLSPMNQEIENMIQKAAADGVITGDEWVLLGQAAGYDFTAEDIAKLYKDEIEPAGGFTAWAKAQGKA